MLKTSAAEREEIKRDVLQKISDSALVRSAPKSMFKIGQSLIHIRFCKRNASSPTKYKFNINPNTLRAEFELWICGDSSCFYLMPMSFIKQLYDHPQAYEDYHHPDIKVVSVDIQTNEVMYARGGESASLMKYKNASL